MEHPVHIGKIQKRHSCATKKLKNDSFFKFDILKSEIARFRLHFKNLRVKLFLPKN